MPWFDWFFTSSLAVNDLAFTNDEKVPLIDVPMLILHAQDDAVIPFKLGKSLHEAALRSRKGSGVEFREFDGAHGYGHSICRAPELPGIVKQFVKECQEGKKISES